MEKKIQELNESLSDASLSLQPAETAILTELFGALTTNNASQLGSKHILTLVAVIRRWPNDQVFPGKTHVFLSIQCLTSKPCSYRSFTTRSCQQSPRV